MTFLECGVMGCAAPVPGRSPEVRLADVQTMLLERRWVLVKAEKGRRAWCEMLMLSSKTRYSHHSKEA